MFRSVMLRFVLPVALASCVVAYFGLPYIQRLLAEWFRSDVELRAQLVMHSMEEPITDLVEKGNETRLRAYLAKTAADERLLAILICRPNGATIFKSERTPTAISCEAGGDGTSSRILQLPSGSVHHCVVQISPPNCASTFPPRSVTRFDAANASGTENMMPPMATCGALG